MAKLFLPFIILLISIQSFGLHPEEWMKWQEKISIEKLIKNVSPEGAATGAIIASPSKNPDYFYHWIRDAAIAANTLVSLYKNEKKDLYFTLLVSYAKFSRKNQLTPTLTGLGEPKFYADGTAFNGPWGRPQNDGPALRALAMIRFANILLEEGKEELVRKLLYRPTFPADTLIKEDLEYVSHHWSEYCFDIWEELFGRHFFTLMVQRKALILGAELAQKLNDPGAANWYLEQAKAIEPFLSKFWNGNIIVGNIERIAGVDYKTSGLDTSVILAITHASEEPFNFRNEKVLATFTKLQKIFRDLYFINSYNLPAIAIGRYPEDKFDGLGSSEGNPWILTTLAFGEFLHNLAKEYMEIKNIEINDVNKQFFTFLGFDLPNGKIVDTEPTFKHIIDRLNYVADEYILRVSYHNDENGSFSEQFNRYSGLPQGASDLTWSYAAYLNAYWSRNLANTQTLE